MSTKKSKIKKKQEKPLFFSFHRVIFTLSSLW